MKTSLILAFLVTAWAGKGPELNFRIIEYVNTVIGQRVDSGECWDLAAAALKYAGARHDLSSPATVYVFGRLYQPELEEVMPGDIIQFQNVEVEWQEGNNIITERYGHHTAIVYAVHDNGILDLAHQNTAETGKKVGVSRLNLNAVVRGKLLFYRPELQ